MTLSYFEKKIIVEHPIIKWKYSFHCELPSAQSLQKESHQEIEDLAPRIHLLWNVHLLSWEFAIYLISLIAVVHFNSKINILCHSAVEQEPLLFIYLPFIINSNGETNNKLKKKIGETCNWCYMWMLVFRQITCSYVSSILIYVGILAKDIMVFKMPYPVADTEFFTL